MLGSAIRGPRKRSAARLMRWPTWVCLARLTSRGANQAGELRLGVHEKPRVDRDAVAADAGSGRQDIEARVQVGELDDVPGVDLRRVANQRQFVREGDVD